ncbi:MAG: hypothetical protein ACOY3P_01600 [Planctomycetota bacterium]
MSIAFRELAGSPHEFFGPAGMRAERRIVVAWEDRHAMVALLIGQGYPLAGTPPSAYPGRPAIVAAEVKLEPWPAVPAAQAAFDDVTADLNSYDGRLALLTIEYKWLEFVLPRGDLPEPEPGTLLTYRMELGCEYVPIAGLSLRWVAAGEVPVPPDAVPAVRVPIVEHHVTWHRVTDPPWQAIRQCTGTVNQNAFLGAAAETVLFDGAVASRQFVGLAELDQPHFGWKITYIFREKAIKAAGQVFGWNHHYRELPADNPGWDKLVDGDGAGLYRLNDFLPLFHFAAG